MEYKQNYNHVIQRLSDLYSGKGKDKIYAKIYTKSKTIEKYADKYPSGEMEYPELGLRASFWEDYLLEQQDIDDDSMPCAYMSEFDEGLYAGLLGAETRFMYNSDWGWVSSMSVPFVKDVTELMKLKPNMDSEWG
jgi:hypothetical protein